MTAACVVEWTSIVGCTRPVPHRCENLQTYHTWHRCACGAALELRIDTTDGQSAVVEAMRWPSEGRYGDAKAVRDWVRGLGGRARTDHTHGLVVETGDGEMTVLPGDFVVRVGAEFCLVTVTNPEGRRVR